MNDRFKFRVFCKSRGDYVEKMFDLTILYDGRLVEYDGLEQDMDNHVIEQCTGLKDKNGNLIYEGDIIQTIMDDVLFIKWRDGEARFAAEDDDIAYDLEDVVDGCEIISNTHKQGIHEQKDDK